MGKRSAENVTAFWDIVTSAKARKFQVVVIGILVSACTAGLLPAAVSVWIILIVNVLVAAGVYQIPNVPQTLVLQPAGTEPDKADVVIEAPDEAVAEVLRGSVKG